MTKNLRKSFIPNLNPLVTEIFYSKFALLYCFFCQNGQGIYEQFTLNWLSYYGENISCISFTVFILVPEASRLSMIGGVALLAIALFLSILSVCIEKDVHFAMTTIYTIACKYICV